MTASQHRRTPETRPRCLRGPDGRYRVRGRSFRKLRGSRAEVVAGVAYQTTGGLARTDLRVAKVRRKDGRSLFASRRKQAHPTGGWGPAAGLRASGTDKD